MVIVRVTMLLSPAISVKVAILVRSLGVARGAWQASGGGHLWNTTRALDISSPLITVATRGVSDPGFV